jgi:uncharacterized protein (UPF0335 family)
MERIIDKEITNIETSMALDAAGLSFDDLKVSVEIARAQITELKAIMATDPMQQLTKDLGDRTTEVHNIFLKLIAVKEQALKAAKFKPDQQVLEAKAYEDFNRAVESTAKVIAKFSQTGGTSLKDFGTLTSAIMNEIQQDFADAEQSQKEFTRALESGTSLIASAFGKLGLATTDMAEDFGRDLSDIQIAATKLKLDPKAAFAPFVTQIARMMISLKRTGQEIPAIFQTMFNVVAKMHPQIQRIIGAWESLPKATREAIERTNIELGLLKIPSIIGIDAAVQQLEFLGAAFESVRVRFEAGDISRGEFNKVAEAIQKIIKSQGLLEKAGDKGLTITLPIEIIPEIEVAEFDPLAGLSDEIQAVYKAINTQRESRGFEKLFPAEAAGAQLREFVEEFKRVKSLFEAGQITGAKFDLEVGIIIGKIDKDRLRQQAGESIPDEFPIDLIPEVDLTEVYGPAGAFQVIQGELDQAGFSFSLDTTPTLESFKELETKYSDLRAVTTDPLQLAVADEQLRAAVQQIERLGGEFARLGEVIHQIEDMDKFLKLVNTDLAAAKRLVADLVKESDKLTKPWLDVFDAIDAWVQGGMPAVAQAIEDAEGRIIEFGETSKQMFRELTVRTIDEFAYALADAFFEGRDALKKFAKEAIKQLTAMIVKALILQAIMRTFGGVSVGGGVAAGAGGGGFGGGVTSTTGATGGQFFQRDFTGFYKRGGIVPPAGPQPIVTGYETGGIIPAARPQPVLIGYEAGGVVEDTRRKTERIRSQSRLMGYKMGGIVQPSRPQSTIIGYEAGGLVKEKRENKRIRPFPAQRGMIVPGIDTGEDKVLIAARPKEAVLPPSLTDFLMRAATQEIHRPEAAERVVAPSRRTAQSPDRPGTTALGESPASGQLIIQIQAWDSNDVRRFFEKHHEDLAHGLRHGRLRRTM